MPSSVLRVGEKAFAYCEDLEDISLSSSLRTIDIGTFYNCQNLKKIDLQEGITRIREFAFESCSKLESISLPNSITRICNRAFKDCKNLRSVILPEQLDTIENTAFYGCSLLDSIVLPENLKSIEKDAFANCKLMTVFAKMKEPCRIKDNHFYSQDRKGATLYVPQGTKTAYERAGWGRAFSYIKEQNPNAIITPSLNPKPSTLNRFDLSGRRLSVPSASSVRSVLPKGVYIEDGKKKVRK